MKTLEIVVRRLFFFGSFFVAALAVVEKLANILRHSLTGPNFPPVKLMEIAAIGLLFTIVMELHAIRVLLSCKPAEPPK